MKWNQFYNGKRRRRVCIRCQNKARKGKTLCDDHLLCELVRYHDPFQDRHGVSVLSLRYRQFRGEVA